MPQIISSTNNSFGGSLQSLLIYLNSIGLIYISLLMFVSFSNFIGKAIISVFILNASLVNLLIFITKFILFCIKKDCLGFNAIKKYSEIMVI